MVVTILETDSKSKLELRCKDQRFVREFGADHIECHTAEIYSTLSYVASWANNSLRESCLFEVN